ncbi:cation transporter [Planctomycetota bacterium]
MSCTRRVRATIEKLDGVAKVKVDFGKKLVKVTVKKGKKLDKKKVEAALKKEGFGLTSFKDTLAKEKPAEKEKA